MSGEWDYLELEGLIMARLAAGVAGVRVLSAADLAGVAEEAQVTPAIHVIYAGDRIVESDQYGTARVAQQWLVVVAVRNARSQRRGEAARSDAGPIAQQVLATMKGWEPGSRWSYARRVAAPKPVFSAGFLYVPFQFEMEAIA